MTEPAALSGTFSDFKIVKGRKVAQLVVEIPIEEADRALKILGGVPRSDIGRWVAIARLNVGPQMSGSAAGLESGGAAGPEPAAVTPGGPAPKERRPFRTLPRSQQAALACQDEGFQRWIRNYSPSVGTAIWEDSCFQTNEDRAAQMVRLLCDVESRNRLAWDVLAAERWDALYAEYQIASGRMAEPR